MKGLASRGKWWTMVYEYHQRTINPALATSYAKDTEFLTRQELLDSWSRWKEDNRNPPMPIDLISISKPRESFKSKSNRLSSLLITEAGRNGSYWTWHEDFDKQFREKLGDLAYHVIQNRGGWSRFCSTIKHCDNFETFKAQLRDEIEATLEADSKGTLGQVISLPEKSRPQGLTSSNDLVKHITGKLDETR